MAVVLTALVVFAFVAGLFALRYFVGEKIFWGRNYLRQGYQILLSRRFDAYWMDSLAVCFLCLLVFLGFCSKTALFPAVASVFWVLLICFMLTFLAARQLEAYCIFYNEQGLLLSKLFHPLRSVSWSEIGGIRKKSASAQLYNILDLSGRRLAWFALTAKNQAFLDLAQKNAVPVNLSKGSRVVLEASGKRLNGTLGAWDNALALSAYARHNVIAYAVFQDFMVALFMDRHLSEDNVAAINRDGSIRWKFSDLVSQSGPISCVALSPEDSNTVSVMAVTGRQSHCVIYEVDVYAGRIVRQQAR